MILGIGNDIVDIRRIEATLARKGQRFIDRLFTRAEQTFCEQRPNPSYAYARHYAAKEAAVKALGTGFTCGVGWRCVEVVRRRGQKPTLAFHGAALHRLSHMTPEGYVAGWDMSMSDEPPYATAIVILHAVREGKQVAPPAPRPYSHGDKS